MTDIYLAYLVNFCDIYYMKIQTILDRIQRLRKEKSYSFDYIGMRMGFTGSYVARILRGDRPLRLEDFLKISEILEEDPGFFITGRRDVFYKQAHEGDLKIDDNLRLLFDRIVGCFEGSPIQKNILVFLQQVVEYLEWKEDLDVKTFNMEYIAYVMKAHRQTEENKKLAKKEAEQD